MSLLTVAIPAYKRPGHLLCALESVAAGACDGLEVLVVDDSGNRSNAAVVEQVGARHPGLRLRLVDNPSNCGIDENIKRCIALAAGDYVWPIGEDDLIVPARIAEVMALLREQRPRFLFVNYVYANSDFTHLARNDALHKDVDAIARSQAPQAWHFDAFLAHHTWVLGFIGACVIRCEDWLATPYERYAGTYFSHVGGIIDMCLNGSIWVDPRVAVLNRAEDPRNFTWSSEAFAVFASFFEVLERSSLRDRPELLAKAVDSAGRLFPLDSLRWLLGKRAEGAFDDQVYRQYYGGRRPDALAWHAAARLIARLPVGPMQGLRAWQVRRQFCVPNQLVRPFDLAGAATTSRA